MPSRPVTKSPTAAFGRLRISSPGTKRGPPRNRRSLNDLSSVATEKTPLKAASSMESIESVASPPVLVWIWPALICAMAYALYNIFIKKGSAHINPVVGGVILQLVAALLGMALLSALVWKDGYESMNMDKEGVNWAICAGVAVGTAEILSFIVSGMGVQATNSIPVIIGLSVVFGTTLGYVALHEELTGRGWMGVFLIAAGITLVGIDPGGAGSVH